MPRVISLGLSKPSELKGDIIYVSLEKVGEEIKAEAVSNEEFEYEARTAIGGYVHGRDKWTSNSEGNKYGSWCGNYQKFLDRLVKNNEGVLDYHRLVKESTLLYSGCKNIAEIISEQQ